MISRLAWKILYTFIVNFTGKILTGRGFEPGSPALRIGALTNWVTQTNHWVLVELFTY